LTLSICALGREGAESAGVVAAALGIVIIGCLNFGVSFVLALAVALRARQVARSDRLRLLFSIIATFTRSPFQFFFPVGSIDAPRVHGPVSVPPSQGPHP
jgi:site-specific recombinase